MNIKSIISVLILGVLLVGCSTLGKVHMEVLRAPIDSLRIGNQTIGVSNGFLQKNAKTKKNFKNLVKYDKYRLDSLISVESIIALKQTIEDAGLLKIGVFDSVGTMRVGGSYVSIDQVDIRSEVETEPMYVHSRGAYYAAVRVPYKIQWSINLVNNKPVTKVYTDTLWTEGYDVAFDNLADLVRFDNVIEYIISKTTFNFARMISPVWEETTRYYYRSGNNDFLRASYFMDNKQYDEAALIWQKYAENSRGTIASNANLNLAVYHELKGDIDEAIIFCEKSVELKNDIAKKYLKLLNERKNEIQKILKY
jgi:tetratricopeptide (TPR) repeat protein